MLATERAGSPLCQQQALAVLWLLLSRSRMEVPLNPWDLCLWSMSWAPAWIVFWQRWSAPKDPTAGDKAEYSPVRTKKANFYLFYTLNSPVATLRLKFSVLEAAVIFLALQVVQKPQECSHNGTELRRPCSHPCPSAVPGRGDLQSLFGVWHPIVSSSRRYWKDPFLQTPLVDGEQKLPLICAPHSLIPSSTTLGFFGTCF